MPRPHVGVRATHLFLDAVETLPDYDLSISRFSLQTVGIDLKQGILNSITSLTLFDEFESV